MQYTLHGKYQYKKICTDEWPLHDTDTLTHTHSYLLNSFQLYHGLLLNIGSLKESELMMYGRTHCSLAKREQGKYCVHTRAKKHSFLMEFLSYFTFCLSRSSIDWCCWRRTRHCLHELSLVLYVIVVFRMLCFRTFFCCCFLCLVSGRQTPNVLDYKVVLYCYPNTRYAILLYLKSWQKAIKPVISIKDAVNRLWISGSKWNYEQSYQQYFYLRLLYHTMTNYENLLKWLQTIPEK